MNREDWLTEMIAALRGRFESAGAKLPEGIKVSCSWPKGSAQKVLGQYFEIEGRAPEVFISPKLDSVDEVGGTLVHELVHAAVGHAAGHGPAFRKVALAVGLEGKMTSTVAGEALKADLEELGREIGDYPHLKIPVLPGAKKQTTRMHKAECGSCGYTVRISQKWIDLGVPECPLCEIGLSAEKKG